MGRAETGGRGVPGKVIKSGRESQSRRAGGEIEASSEWVRGGSRKGDRVEPGKAIDASRRGASEAAVGGVQGWPGEAIEGSRSGRGMQPMRARRAIKAVVRGGARRAWRGKLRRTVNGCKVGWEK